MFELENKSVVVLGLGPRGRAACELLRRGGARVTALDRGDDAELRATAEALRGAGIEVSLDAVALPDREFSLAVISPSMPPDSGLVRSVVQRGLPVVGELEFGFQQAKCLTIAVAGTNGKGTTGELIER